MDMLIFIAAAIVFIVVCSAAFRYFLMRSPKSKLSNEVRNQARRHVDLHGPMDSNNWGGF